MASVSGSNFGGGGGAENPRFSHQLRLKCDALEQENRILKATNRHLKLLLRNATSEIESLKGLLTEVESSHRKPGSLIVTPSLQLQRLTLDDEEEQDSPEDPNQLLSLLPEEVWETILSHVPSSHDIQSFIRAFPPWDTLLHNTKPCWLLDQVLPLLYLYLDRTSFLHLRLTCHRWRSAVNLFLTDNATRRPTPQGPFVRLKPLSLWLHRHRLLNNLITPLKSEILLNECPPHKNPFLGHHATFKFAPECHHFEPCLLQWGRHLLYLRLESHENGASWLFWLLVDILRHLPHLRKLDLSLQTVLDTPSGLLPTYLSSLESSWRDNHLPPLPHLETLEIIEHDLFHGHLLKSVLLTTYAHTLRRVGVNHYAFPPGAPPFPHLTELTVSVNTDLQLSSLLRLGGSAVQRLTLYVTFNEHDPAQDYPSMALLFRVISHFGRTLRSLYLQFPEPPAHLEWGHLPNLELSQLTTLGLRECTPLTFNVLLPLSRSLRYLHLHSYRLRTGQSPPEMMGLGGQRPEIVDLHLYLQRGVSLYHSNVWEILGRLEEVTVSFPGLEEKERRYTRQSWEKRRAKTVNL